MVKLKPTPSKRQTTRQRVKIQKRVAEHHRKARRAAKKNPQWKSRVPKDPGIPNSFPFKEQLLEEVRQKRVAEEEAKLAAREQVRLARAQRKAHAGDAASEEESEGDEAQAENEEEFLHAAHSLLVQAPVYRGSLDDLMQDSSFHSILVALDARDPLSWVTPSLSRAAQSHSKRFGYVLTRTDLVPREVVDAWTMVLEAQFSAPVFPVVVGDTHEQPLGLGPVLQHVRAGAPSKSEPTRVVVCGMEHSGRSAIANRLRSFSSALHPVHDDEDDAPSAGPPEGQETSSNQQVVEVYDSVHLISAQDPGKEDMQASALRQLIRNKGAMQKSKDIELLARGLVSRVARILDLQLFYNLPAFAAGADHRSGTELTDTELLDFCMHLARATGFLSKHGVALSMPVWRKLVFDWSHGAMMYYATPPVSRSEASQQTDREGEANLPSTRAGLQDVLLPIQQWKAKFGRKLLRLLPGPVDPRTLEWDYMFFVPASERSDRPQARATKPDKGKKAVQFADPNGSESEAEAELTESESEESEDEDAGEDEDGDLSDGWVDAGAVAKGEGESDGEGSEGSHDVDNEMEKEEEEEEEVEKETKTRKKPEKASRSGVATSTKPDKPIQDKGKSSKRKAEPQTSHEEPAQKKQQAKPSPKEKPGEKYNFLAHF